MSSDSTSPLQSRVAEALSYFRRAREGGEELVDIFAKGNDVCGDYLESARIFREVDDTVSACVPSDRRFLFLAATAYFNAALYASAKLRHQDALSYAQSSVQLCQLILGEDGNPPRASLADHHNQSLAYNLREKVREKFSQTGYLH